jgi:hypothetical protein
VISKEEEKGLRDIFIWYASQHKKYGANPTFDELTAEKETMDSGTFARFLMDFGVCGD